jgi:putative endonuclease
VKSLQVDNLTQRTTFSENAFPFAPLRLYVKAIQRSDSMAHKRQKLGASGEALAVRHLEEAGLTIVERNWRCGVGELDVIAREDAPDFSVGGQVVPWLVIVEVRTRRGDSYGTALQSITPRKAAKLREVAAHYIHSAQWTGPWRIDVVAVQMDAGGKLQQVEHIRHAVRG